MPPEQAKKLPRYPVPVFLLAQVAVHQDYQDRGLGGISLVKALEHFWAINAEMKAYAVITDYLNQAVETFYAHYGFRALCTHHDRKRMFLPMKTVAQLFSE